MIFSLLESIAKKIVAKHKPIFILVVGDYRSDCAYSAINSVVDNKTPFMHIPQSKDDKRALVYGLLGRVYKDERKDMSVLVSGLKLLFSGADYPKTIVANLKLSLAGSSDYVLQYGKPKILAITHTEFESQDEQLLKLIEKMSKDDVLILNADRAESNKYMGKEPYTLTIGLNENAILRAKDASLSQDDMKRVSGIAFKIEYQGNTVPVKLNGVLGASHMWAALIGAGCGLVYKMNLMDVAKELNGYDGPAGNLKLIPGIKKTMLLDDTEDATQYTCLQALKSFSNISTPDKSEKFAVIGDIVDLGARSEEGHREIGKAVVDAKVDYLIVVGERARDVLRGARDAGLPEDRGYQFARASEAGKFLQNRLEEGDAVMVTGGKEMKMEKIVLEVMEKPLDAKMLLVRQESLRIK